MTKYKNIIITIALLIALLGSASANWYGPEYYRPEYYGPNVYWGAQDWSTNNLIGWWTTSWTSYLPLYYWGSW